MTFFLEINQPKHVAPPKKKVAPLRNSALVAALSPSQQKQVQKAIAYYILQNYSKTG